MQSSSSILQPEYWHYYMIQISLVLFIFHLHVCVCTCVLSSIKFYHLYICVSTTTVKILHTALWRNVYSDIVSTLKIYLFIFLLLSCKHSLYTYFSGYKSYQIYDFQIFTPIFVDCLFTFLMESLVALKSLTLLNSSLSIFFFCHFSFDVLSKMVFIHSDKDLICFLSIL